MHVYIYFCIHVNVFKWPTTYLICKCRVCIIFPHRPLLSREIVEKKPHLHGAYLKIEKAFEARGSYNEIKQMTYDLANEIGEDDAYTRTVIADATIYCKEFFQIKDASTGFVVQGMEDGWEEAEVVHHVRFEVVTEKTEDGVRRKVGQWKIIDIDDLLEGNVFH